MQLVDINITCKTQIFKDIVSDLMYSIRSTFRKFTENNLDIKLSRIRTTPIGIIDEFIVKAGRIKNLVGGKVACALENNFVEYLEANSDIDVATFVDDMFDNLSSVSKNGVLQISLDEISEIKWDNNLYYIQYNIKFKNESGRDVSSRMIFAVDELTSIYFKD